MGSVKFNKQNNRRKRTVPGIDHYVGLAFYTNVLPTGFSITDRMKLINDPEHAETLGITANNADLKIKVLRYHIDQAFRINPDAVFYLGIYAIPVGTHTFSELGLLRTFSQGKITKVGVWSPKAYITGDIALLQGIYNDSFAQYAMHEIYYSPNLYGVTDANLPSYSASTSPNVHVVIAQDGAALGKTLYDAIVDAEEEDSYSVGAIGLTLGALSLAKCSESIAWVEKFDLAMEGGEYDVPALSNGSIVSELSDNLIKDEGTFDTKRLIFLKKYPQYTGSYFNDNHGCVIASDDYAYGEDNHTIDKAIRGLYVTLLPNVNGPNLLDKATGKLAAASLTNLELKGNNFLLEMEKAGELSGATVVIDPEDDVRTSGKITFAIALSEILISRRFQINIGY